MKANFIEGFKTGLYNDLHAWVMNNPSNSDLAWHESKSSLAEFLCEKGWEKVE